MLELHWFVKRSLGDRVYNGTIRLFGRYSDETEFDILRYSRGTMLTSAQLQNI